MVFGVMAIFFVLFRILGNAITKYNTGAPVFAATVAVALKSDDLRRVDVAVVATGRAEREATSLQSAVLQRRHRQTSRAILHLYKRSSLRTDITARNGKILALRDGEQDALARLSSLQHAEVEQVLRLEIIQADEQKRQSECAELEQRRAILGEEIRLDLLATSENALAGTASQRRDMHVPDHGASLRQGTSQVKKLVAEAKKLRALVADLTLQFGRLDDERQSQVQPPSPRAPGPTCPR